VPIIPGRANAQKKARCPTRVYRLRQKIQNFFRRLKDWRRVATRYNKLARNFLATTSLVRRRLSGLVLSPDPGNHVACPQSTDYVNEPSNHILSQVGKVCSLAYLP